MPDRDMTLFRLACKRGFLWTPCPECSQQMVVARSGKRCLNCGEKQGEPDA